MRQNALPEGAFPVFGASWTNTDIKKKTIDTIFRRSAAKTGFQEIFNPTVADRLLLKTEDVCRLTEMFEQDDEPFVQGM